MPAGLVIRGLPCRWNGRARIRADRNLKVNPADVVARRMDTFTCATAGVTHSRGGARVRPRTTVMARAFGARVPRDEDLNEDASFRP